MDRGGERGSGRFGGGSSRSSDRRKSSDTRPKGRGGRDEQPNIRTPVILKPPVERVRPYLPSMRHGHKHGRQDSLTSGPAPSLIPGSVSIIQREPSGGSLQLPSSPLAPQPLFDGPPSPQTFKGHYDRDERRRPARRPDGLSSGPSNFTPLQPVARPTSRDRDPNIINRSDHSVLLSQGGTEMSYAIKLVDKSLHWEDRGMENMMDQGDFLVVGVLGREGVGKSTVMSLLAGTRTGATKPYMFRAQPKEIADNGGYQTTGIDMVVTGERVILLDTQPILSGAMLDQLAQSDQIPSNISPETYLDVLSLQMAIFLYSVCHVVMVMVDSTDSMEDVFKFLRAAEQLKTTCFRGTLDVPTEAGEKPRDYLPQIVFVLNHASPDDFQPSSLRELHQSIAKEFESSKLQVASGVSLFNSGVIPTGVGFPSVKPYKKADEINPADINLHLLPSNPSLADSYSVHTTSRPEKQERGLTPVLALLPMYTGHPSFQLLSDTLRNQLFSMLRPPIRRTSPAQQQFTEREWLEYARRVWLTVKKSDLVTEYEHLLPPN